MVICGRLGVYVFYVVKVIKDENNGVKKILKKNYFSYFNLTKVEIEPKVFIHGGCLSFLNYTDKTYNLAKPQGNFLQFTLDYCDKMIIIGLELLKCGRLGHG